MSPRAMASTSTAHSLSAVRSGSSGSRVMPAT
jgi:hypothetical protein